MVFVPITDDNPRRYIRRPWVTWSLVAANAAVWLVFQSGYVVDAYQASALSYGLIPSVFFGQAVLPDGFEVLPNGLQLLTSLFLHGDILHLAGNMLFLLVLADNIEDAMGRARFLAFYLICGMAASLAHAYAMPTSDSPLIGASGAISGIIAAYLVLHPRVKIWALLFARIPVHIAAMWVIGLWVVVQIASGLLGSDDNVGWWAHIGGFLAGLALVPFFKRPEVPWFGKRLEANFTPPL